VHTPARDPFSGHVFHQYTLKLGDAGQGASLRDGLALHFTEKGIPHGIYYPIPIHRQPAYLKYGIDPADLPVTEDLTNRVISLPMHTELTEEVQGRIVGELAAYLRSL
jgi:dTDP-4-amino-4,6-dideoxygalactose transaminase